MSVPEIWALPFLGPILPIEDFVRQIMNSLEKSYPQALSREHRKERRIPLISATHNKALS